MKKSKIFAGIASAAMLVSMAGCSGSGSSGGSGSDSTKTLIVGTTQELSGVFSPLYYTSTYDSWAINLVYNSMLKYTADSKLTTDLASEMPTVSDDGKTVTFKLKEGIKFSDGTDLTGDDVKFTFTLMADPTYDGRFTDNVVFIEGYNDYHDGDAEELTGIEVVDDYTVVFHLNTERIDAIPTLGGQAIMSNEQFEYSKGNLGDYKDKTSEPMGTNAYVLNSYDKATGASFVKNENYTGDGEYKIPRVIIKTIATATELTSLETKDINYLPSIIESNIIGPASLNDELTYNHYFRSAEGYIGFNCVNGPTDDQAVRKALAYATNRQEFCDNFYAYTEGSDEVKQIPLGYVPTVYWNPVSANLGNYVTGKEKLDGLETYEYNLDTAKKILDDAGWVPGSNGIREKDGKKLEIKFLATEGNSVLDQLIPILQKSWKELGVDLKQNTVDFNTMSSTVDTSNKDTTGWNIFFMAMGYTGVENSGANTSLKGGGGDNYSRIDNKEMNDLLDKAYETMDQTTSVDNYKKAMILENDLMPYLPIYGNELFNIYATNVKGIETGPVRDWSQALDTAYIE